MPDASPLTAAELRAVLDGRTLPGRAYTADEVLTWELANLFDRGWVCVGRAADLDRPGAQRAVVAGTEPILLVRDEDRVRAFYDVCRHRGHLLLEPGTAACAPSIRCPYHGWAYRLDGRRRPDGLVPVPVADWHGWLLVNPSGDAAPVDGVLAGLDDVVAPYSPGELAVVAHHDYEVAANWKLLVENYHECFHCPSIHPELCRVSPPSSGTSLDAAGAWVGGPMDLAEGSETMSLDGCSRGRPLPGLDPLARRRVQYIGVFPNLLLSLHPDYVMAHRIEPLAPGRSRVSCSWLMPPGVDDPSYAVEFWDTVNRQDWRACESVQRGVASRGYVPGRLTERERDVGAFLRLVVSAHLAAAGVTP